MAIFSAPFGIQIYLISKSDERLAILSDSDLTAPILNARVFLEKFGGVTNFSFQIPRDSTVPITKNTVCFFYISGVLSFGGYIIELPTADQKNPVLTIKGDGFFKKLKDKTINVSYSSQTLSYIVDDLGTNYLGSDIGVFYNAGKIDVPSLSNITIEFKDKTLDQVFKTLLKICNYDYDNNKYIFYVDIDKEIVFEHLSEDLQKTIFEGFQYQNPIVSKDNTKIINRISAYRTESGDDNLVEYVDDYEDGDSIDRYDLYHIKLTFSDFINTDTIENICNAILQRRSQPQVKIKLENYEITGSLPFGKYSVFNKRWDYWQLVTESDSLEGWDLGGVTNTTVTLSEDHVLTGKQSLKFETTSGSENEYVEFILTDKIQLPKLLRMFIYFQGTTSTMEAQFFDSLGNVVIITFGVEDLDLDVDHETLGEQDFIVNKTAGVDEDFIVTSPLILVNEWMKINQELGSLDVVETLQLYDGTTTENFEVNLDVSTVEDLQVRSSSNEGLLDIVKVRIVILTNAVTTFYVDRIEALANTYSTHKLQLEKIEYNLSATGLFSNPEFGDKADDIIDEIKNKVKNGDLALQVFSKQ